jgi:hypothetical protein
MTTTPGRSLFGFDTLGKLYAHGHGIGGVRTEAHHGAVKGLSEQKRQKNVSYTP